MSIEAYQLIEIVIGSDIVPARPIGWDGEDSDGFGNDESGNPIKAATFETTCPKCSQLLTFNADDRYTAMDGVENHIKCTECGAGAEPLGFVIEEEPEIESVNVVVEDPLKTGSVNMVNYDLDLLKTLEGELGE